MRASQNTQRALCYLCKRQLAKAEFKATSEIWCVGIVDTRRRWGDVRESTTARNEVDACFRAVSTGVQSQSAATEAHAPFHPRLYFNAAPR